MSAVLFPEDAVARLLMAAVCYFGVVLYATSAVIRGPARAQAEAFVGFVYAAMFPLPSSLPLAYLIQFCVFVASMAMLGALQLRRSVLRSRELRAYRAGTTAGPLPAAATFAIFFPAVALTLYLVISVAAFADWRASWSTSTEVGLVRVVSVVGLLSFNMGLSSYLDRDWVRSVGRIRLLTVDSRFQWINAVVAVVAVVVVAVILISGPGSRTSGYAALVAVTVGLLPALNGLSWIYDAVFRRVLSFHLLLAALAVVALAVKPLESPLSLSPLATWAVLLGALGLTAVALPPLIDRGLERWLFPRAGEMRARLMAIAAKPPAARTRAEAAASMLDDLIRVLDAEGGAIVVHPAGSEPAAIERVGAVDTSLLGSSPEEVARYVGSVAAQGGPQVMENLPLPHVIENLPLADQLRLLDAGVYLICPLVAHRTEATLLLGPRRGWLYDEATIRALRVLARQLGLALENLTLANARAHGEKLEALGGAAARIAHEIRNPLAGARSLVQLLGRTDADGLASPAVEELDRIGRLVDELLAFARRDDAGARETVDLATVCAEAIRETAGLAAGAPIEVRAELGAVFVRGDRRRLVQVFANLCRNAIEALGDTAPPRCVTVRSGALHDIAVVEVRDNGPGIPVEQQLRIFEPFCTTKGSGTGLGLPIARGIVESHGGRIAVESVCGTETVFRVELPLADARDLAQLELPSATTTLRKAG